MSKKIICIGTTTKGTRCKKKVREKFCNLHNNIIDIPLPEECSICFDNITEIDSCLECGHIFHTQCIIQLNLFNCPLCRYDSKIIQLHKKQINDKIDKLLEKVLLSKELHKFIIEKNNWEINHNSIVLSQLIIIKNINYCKSIINREIIKGKTYNEMINILFIELNNLIIIKNYSNLFMS